MAEIRDSSSDRASSRGAEKFPKVFPVAAVDEPSLFKSSKAPGKTWDNDSLGDFYKPIDTYEGIHRYDPDFQWEAKEEKKLVRKVRFSQTYILVEDHADMYPFRLTTAFAAGFA